MKLNEVVQHNMLDDLLKICKTELGISELPEIDIVSNSSTIQGTTSFGLFTGDKISVVSKDRHPMDVMRTLAHEIVHWSQSINGQELDGSDGSETENEANSVAGVIMRKFGKMHPEYFVNSLSQA